MARNCPSCGRANDDDAQFCAGCGAKLPAACASCGAELAPDAAFCKSCGAGVAGAAAKQPAPAQPATVPGPPIVPPPPAAPAGPPQPPAAPSGTPGPPRKGVHPALIVGIIVAVLVVVAIAAFFVFVYPTSSDSGGGTTTPKPTPRPTPVSSNLWPGGQPFLAAAAGIKGNHLATIGADGAVHELAANVGSQIFQVAWSPDGARLACIGGSWKRSRVWIYDAASGAAKPIALSAPNVVAVDSIAWLSAHELLIAGFTVTPKNTGENAEFVVYDPATDSSQPLADPAGVALRGVSVSASSDGSKVAFVTYTDRKKDQYGMASAKERLELLDRGAGAVKQLGSSKAFFDVNARAFDHPLISPAGDAVIYRRAGSDVGTSYTVLDANGVALMPAMESQFPAGYAWDPAGDKVVFTGHASSTSGNGIGPAIFYVFDAKAGGKAEAIARYKNTMVQELSWSPDGSTIAFADYDQDQYQTGSIYLMSPSGGDAHFLMKGALWPVWAPEAKPSPAPSPSATP
jgi:Tol biopolymer transport system component